MYPARAAWPAAVPASTMASMNAVQLSSTSTTGGNVRWQYICRADVTCVTIAEWSVSGGAAPDRHFPSGAVHPRRVVEPVVELVLATCVRP